MKTVKQEEANKGANSNQCQTLEYSFDDSDMDLGIAVITGRYPAEGYCVNLISKELIYVLGGEGRIYFKDSIVEFKEGDAILIDPNEKYYWQTKYCKVSMTCTPAWTKGQHKLVK